MDELTMILETRPVVDGWVYRGRAIETPQPGSELADEIGHIAEPYMAAYTVLRRGWLLFDQRASAD